MSCGDGPTRQQSLCGDPTEFVILGVELKAGKVQRYLVLGIHCYHVLLDVSGNVRAKACIHTCRQAHRSFDGPVVQFVGTTTA